MSRALVSDARRALVLDFPFFGVLSLKLDLIEKSSVQTFATDGKTIFFNPDFAESLNRHELMGVLAHEVLHCANGHQWRRENRDHKLWNRACDYAINPIVLKAGLKLPEGGLINPDYSGLSAEQIYDRLVQEQMQSQKNLQSPPQNGENGQDQESSTTGQTPSDQESLPGQDNTGSESGQAPSEHDPSDFGSVIDCAEDEMPEMKAEWSEAVLNAARQAEKMGRLPAGMERLVDSIKNPAQNWRSILRRFIQQTRREDYSWQMPNGRYLYAGLYMPALRSESMPEMVVAIDTSGSIDSTLIAQFEEEMNAISDEVRPERIHVLACDARIQAADSFEFGETVKIRPVGGGGTDFRPVFSWVEDQGIEPACLIYLTDMEGRFPQQAPDYPVIWANFGRIEYDPPFGEVVTVRA